MLPIDPASSKTPNPSTDSPQSGSDSADKSHRSFVSPPPLAASSAEPRFDVAHRNPQTPNLSRNCDIEIPRRSSSSPVPPPVEVTLVRMKVSSPPATIDPSAADPSASILAPQPQTNKDQTTNKAQTVNEPSSFETLDATAAEQVTSKSEIDSNRKQDDASKQSDAKPAGRKSQRHPDPILQSLMLLATMALMLAAARFAVPQIVEEIRYSWHRGELRAETDWGSEGLKNVSLDTLSDAYQMVTAAVAPSVVHIEVKRRPGDALVSATSFRRSEVLTTSDQGSGVIVDEEGYIVTNRHVIADGEDVMVTLSDGRRTAAVVVGSDPLTDLAVLKINANKLMPIRWGDSDRCRVGSPVWAVGSPFGLDRTVTFGILSGKHRLVRASTQYQDFMQSDVAVNPGNSGGPLVDARGTLIGINTAIVGDTYQGVSFSIPSNVAQQIYERLKASGRVERGWLGVGLADVADHELIGDDARVRGAMISGLADKESPAAVAGLRKGDLILRVNNKQVTDRGHLMRIIGESLADTIVDVEIYRENEKQIVPVRLGSRPDFEPF